jgi:hypothetical protein
VYLGYLNLLLSVTLQLDNRNKYAGLNQEITHALARRIDRSPSMLLATYPGEVYTADNCAAIASIAVYNRVTRGPYQKLIDRWVAQCRGTWIDPRTGLLYQSMTPLGDKPQDQGRGSGNTLGVYLLSFVDVKLSSDLYYAVQRHLAGSVLGFGAIREYSRSAQPGPGDIDSGPQVMGFGAAATGFGLAGARVHNDPETFSRLYSTAYLFGSPLNRESHRTFVSGGPLGNAILFAMLTAQPIHRTPASKTKQPNGGKTP